MPGRIIEVDVDGVLASIHSAVDPYLQDICPGFRADERAQSYSMDEFDAIDTRLKTTIFSLFNNPEFIGKLPMFPGTLLALTELNQHLELTGDRLLINTLVCNEVCVAPRKDWLDRVVKSAGIKFEANVGFSKQKEVLNSYVTVEDNIDNLIRSKASIKILIRRGHNRNARVSDFGTVEHLYFCNTFVEAVNIIKDLVI